MRLALLLKPKQTPLGCGITLLSGRLAQLVEHQLDKLGVTGSSPVPPIRTLV